MGIKMAVRNSQDGISLVQTAESGMSEISNMILRMRELAVQMENGIYTAKDYNYKVSANKSDGRS